MITVAYLLILPLAFAILLGAVANQKWRGLIVKSGALLTALGSIWLAVRVFGTGTEFFPLDNPLAEKLVFAGEVAVAAYLLWRCRQLRGLNLYIPALIVVSLAVSAWAEFGGLAPRVEAPLYADNLSAIMALIIGIIGSLIAVYAVSYMEDYHSHHPEIKDNRRGFFFIIFLFLSGMFGVVFSNSLTWLFFSWEITTLCSFLLIGYSGTDEAKKNAFLALGMNVIGGLGFSLAILYATRFSAVPSLDLKILTTGGSVAALIPAVLITFAGMTKSAQLPFSPWLLGAMVAPTPVSALLHSSTMVKAGVFVAVKFAPVLHGTRAGLLVALVGGTTFLVASVAAVTQSNAKRVLAWSTIANLGLVIACAGVGTPEAVWAAILLIIFHAVSKGLLFLGTGTIEHKSGSRDIEDMAGLIVSRPALGLVMMVGIAGMFLAPFGMLISKWASMVAFLDASPLLAVLLAYGSAPTLFFWAKWMGKIASVPPGIKRATDGVSVNEWAALGTLAVLTVLACALYPLAGSTAIVPYLSEAFGRPISIDAGNLGVIIGMTVLFLLVPLAFLAKPSSAAIVPGYYGGANVGEGYFHGSIDKSIRGNTRNYYLASFFSEPWLMKAGGAVSLLVIIGSLLAVFL
jgi:ech hydrogenase subunit A